MTAGTVTSPDPERTTPAYAELHCHTNFSFLDGASAPDDIAARAAAIGLAGVAITDHQGLYGAIRFTSAMEAAGVRPVIGVEIELADAAVPDPGGIAVPGRRPWRPGRRPPRPEEPPRVAEGRPERPRPDRARLPGHRTVVKEDHRGIGEAQRGPHLVLLARDATGWRSLCRMVSRANLAGSKAVPRFTHELLAANTEGLIALSGCRHGEIARRLLAGDREGAAAAARRYAALFGGIGFGGIGFGGIGGSGGPRGASGPRRSGESASASGFVLELQHHLLPDDDWLASETARLADELGLPTVVTNDVHYALAHEREMHDVVTAIRHGRTLAELADLRRPDGESYLKTGADLLALPPGDEATLSTDPVLARAWREGIGASVEIANACRVDLAFERYRFPGFPVPKGQTPFSHLSELCWEGAKRRYHPLTPAVVKQLAHELDVIGKTGLAEFFLICWDLMRFAKSRGIPAQGRGSAAGSIVAYVLGIARVDPIRHELLFERFINEGRTAYPDVDIDFSSERREEVIQYVYNRYGQEHTGMVCNLVTYRARSAVREVGYALGFPRPLVDRVAKALETYDSVMVRRDLEAEGGFGQFFDRPVIAGATGTPPPAEARGLVDEMGQLKHARGGRFGRDVSAEHGNGRMLRPGDDKGGPGDSPVSERWIRDGSPDATQGRHEGSIAGLSDWERWLELCARIDGFPRHLSIHSGGMLVTAAPLIDIAPIERATMTDRVVVQYDKRDVETMKLIKLDLLGLGMLAAIDETVQLVAHDCAVCLDLDRIPEEIPEVFEMLQAADTVGLFQVESRAQMQTLPKSRPSSLDDLVVEVAIIRPGPIQGNAVHPYLRRRQGLEPVTYLHPSLEPILHDTLGVILYQEQVMRIAIEVAGFTAAGSDAFRRAMGTYRSKREMDRLHDEFVGGCRRKHGIGEDDAEDLFRRVAAFASFGFAKSHAAAFARTAYESAFLKLFYPAQFVTALVNAQPMGFYPVEVLVNDAKRHGVAILPVDVNRSAWKTTTEWVGQPGWVLAGADGDVAGPHDDADGEPLPEGCGIERRPRPVRSPACVIPGWEARRQWAAEPATGWGIRLGLHLVKGIGTEQQERLDAELARGPYRDLADVVTRTELPEEVVERLIRTGALDSLGRPRREMLWQLREVAGSAKGGVATAGGKRGAKRWGRAAGRPMDLRLPPTPAPLLPPITEAERLGDAYAVIGLDARTQAVALFREALDRLGVLPIAQLAARRPGRVRIAGLVVTRQHPMTARGTVFLAIEDETGMANVTLWPDTWQRLRSVVRRNALLAVEGDLQREGDVVNVIAREVVPLVDAVAGAGGPDEQPAGMRPLGMAGMRRLG